MVRAKMGAVMWLCVLCEVNQETCEPEGELRLYHHYLQLAPLRQDGTKDTATKDVPVSTVLLLTLDIPTLHCSVHNS